MLAKRILTGQSKNNALRTTARLQSCRVARYSWKRWPQSEIQLRCHTGRWPRGGLSSRTGKRSDGYKPIQWGMIALQNGRAAVW